MGYASEPGVEEQNENVDENGIECLRCCYVQPNRWNGQEPRNVNRSKRGSKKERERVRVRVRRPRGRSERRTNCTATGEKKLAWQ